MFAGVELTPMTNDVRGGHWAMGLGFGGLHLAYGIYLYFTEKTQQAA